MKDEELTLSIGGVDILGWTEVRLTRGIERCPNDFDLTLTELTPGQAARVNVIPGQECEVRLGGETVLTGYVDRYVPSLGPQGHTVKVTGRGKCQDLVDCSAEWDGGQISGAYAAEIARKLAAPYGIYVTLLSEPGPVIPQFNFMLGESPFDIIERICRFSGQLAYEASTGDLLIGAVQREAATRGVFEGVNVKQATVVYAKDQRFSEYHVYLLSAQVFGDVGFDGNLIAVERDGGVRRNRKRYIIAEAPSGGQDITKMRAAWERSRRGGRGTTVIATVDSWRDANARLWEPNTLVEVYLPTLRLPRVSWTLAEVSFIRDEHGTRADLVLMAPEAFTPEPVLLLPIYGGVE